MRKRIVVGLVSWTLAFAAGCAGDPPADAGAPAAAPGLSASPRHHEWVQIPQGERHVRTFVAFPQSATAAPAVVVIHENKGLTEWVRSVADSLAEQGYVALAPDLLSGAGPGSGDTDSFPTSDAATAALGKLPDAQVTSDLRAVADHARTVAGANGKVAVAGFCWGGMQSFRFAADRQDLAAAFVFYGRSPEDEAALARIACPVHGFYAENDARVNATLPATEERMRRLGKAFDAVTYPGAGHAFLRLGEAADAAPANRAARDAAWARWLDLLRGL